MTDGARRQMPIFTRLRPHHRAPDLTGQRFGRLTVTGFAGGDGRKSWWHARCDCGTLRPFVGSELRKGATRSCGCFAREAMSERATTHGMSGHPAYFVWRSMIDRCGLPSHKAYPRYGGRGISVCKAWQSFDRFWSDMCATYEAGLTLERLDNNAGYSPVNCAWRDRRAQARNKRSNVRIETPIGRLLVREAAEMSGLGVTTLLYRVNAGWPTARLFDPPDSGRRVM